MKIQNLVLAAAIAVPTVSTAATFDRFSDVVVFGDSLSDPVVNLPPQFYPNGQVTNGDNWAVQSGFDDPLVDNFAVSGATAKTDGPGDFLDQIDAFSATSRSLGDSALAAVWLGGNDIADALAADDRVARIEDALDALADGLDRLAREGFDQALVFLSPDIGDTPRVRAIDAVVPGTAALATGLTGLFNAQLRTIAGALSETLTLAFVDIPTVAETAKSNAASLGFTNLTDACFRPDGPAFAPGCDLDAADGYFYYDPFHPTDRTHALIADAAAQSVAQLAPVPVPAGFVLMGTAFAALGFAARRRRTA